MREHVGWRKKECHESSGQCPGCVFHLRHHPAAEVSACHVVADTDGIQVPSGSDSDVSGSRRRCVSGPPDRIPDQI